MNATSAAAARYVILVRHAHAEWPDYTGRDFDRPLTARGEQDALATGRAIGAAGLQPTTMLVSPARRTRQTGEIIARELALPVARIAFVDALYNAPAEALATALEAAIDATAGTVMLVAHNPGISQLARELAGSADEPGFRPADWRLLPAGSAPG